MVKRLVLAILLFIVKMSYSLKNKIRGCFVGSGSEGMQSKFICQKIIDLIPSTTTTTKKAANVLYVGTATYDLSAARMKQTSSFKELGCEINDLSISDPSSSSYHNYDEMKDKVDKADIIIASGGNTLYMIDTWNHRGLSKLIKEAVTRGAVVCGGSAGAIAWFDGGHSDSADPDSYQSAMINEAQLAASSSIIDKKDEASEAPATAEDTKQWEYIRAPCLGLLPGLVCPHHDRTQSNGKPRADDFDKMLVERCDNEIGIGIDHFAALVFDGNGGYEVLAIPDKPGSVLFNSGSSSSEDIGFTAKGDGIPGCWKKVVVNGEIIRTLIAPRGRVGELLEEASGSIHEDERVNRARIENPINK